MTTAGVPQGRCSCRTNTEPLRQLKYIRLIVSQPRSEPYVDV
jgi:hypothetical protein